MVKPVIGLTSSRIPNKYVIQQIGVDDAYVQAVLRAGAVPAIIPLGLSEADLNILLSRVDGVIFTGGGDILPQRYNSTPHPLVSFVDEDRDRVEISLFQEIQHQGLPFLGICRGLQVVNVAMGGTLYEDILDQHSGAIQHQFNQDYPRNYRAHPIEIEAESRLAGVIGSTTIQVNSLHHQGIRVLAPGLKATATASDGIIEGVEIKDHPFGLAVQWHPEWMPDDEAMQRLFRALVVASAIINS